MATRSHTAIQDTISSANGGLGEKFVSPNRSWELCPCPIVEVKRCVPGHREPPDQLCMLKHLLSCLPRHCRHQPGLWAASRRIMAAAISPPPKLTFWERNVPYAAMASAKIAGTVLEVHPDPKATKETIATLAFPSGCVLLQHERNLSSSSLLIKGMLLALCREQLVGQPLIVRYMARAGTRPHTLYPDGALAATQVLLSCRTPSLSTCPSPACLLMHGCMLHRFWAVDQLLTSSTLYCACRWISGWTTSAAQWCQAVAWKPRWPL